jgi:predicted transcriptional regulator
MKGETTMLIEKITTNYFKVLSMLYDNKIVVNKKYMIPITQSEVSEMMGINKTTVNRIFKELKSDNLIVNDENKNGRYYITEKGIEVVKRIYSIKGVDDNA